VNIDTSALMQRVIQHALVASLGNEATAADLNQQESEEAIADALGKRLAQIFMSDAPRPLENGSCLAAHSAGELAHYEKLEDRNSALAAALGACDCWGENADCALCQGAGAPGWALPDRPLFLKFVRPALQAVRKSKPSPPRSNGSAVSGAKGEEDERRMVW
jgi:hypothetical protein